MTKIAISHSFQSVQELGEAFSSTSQVIRHLAVTHGHDHVTNNLTGPIAKHLGIRYQWVRNVLTQELKGK